MKKIVLLLCFLFVISYLMHSQSSLVKLGKGYLFIDSIPNLVNIDGFKYGKWIEIEYEIRIKYHIFIGTGADSVGNKVDTNGTEAILDTSKTDFNFFWLGEYNQGKKSGVWRKYDKDYSVISKYEYSMGEIINFKTYYSNGDIKIKGVLQEDSVNINVSKYREGGFIIECKDYSLKEINDIFNYK